MAEKTDSKTTPNYKDTLNLPRTDFPIRPHHKENDAALLARWEQEALAAKAMQCNAGAEQFILHDGPPYANGNIHIGHTYNKILKDFVTKSQRMEGKHVPITPGWDCHGLPIELKVTKEQPGLSRAALMQACRAYAARWVAVQRDEFKKLGVLMDWDHPYLTMDFAYEAAIMRAFGSFVEQGFIEKKNKTVAWCASCETVLASAEIEYEERKDPSIYVTFPFSGAAVAAALPELAGKEVGLLVWTTTPWTLPLNRAVVLKPNTAYVVLEDEGRFVIVGAALADKVCAAKGLAKKVVAQINSDMLIGTKVRHPFIADLVVPVLGDQFVSLEDGTACVHSAPGCGPEDYELGVRYGLEIYSPISPSGHYTDAITPAALAGMSVQDGTGWVLKELTTQDRLFHKTSLRHAYPHCWRCRNGLIFRATKQWFCNLAQKGLRELALQAIETDIAFIPERSRNSLRAAVESRLEWCLSRQRTWGVPIVALLCQQCDKALTSLELIEQVAQGVEKEGVEYWDKVPLAALVQDKVCACGSSDFVKERDILDVWFDSGVSHKAVLSPAGQFPASSYLEGRDQARGWFQSSLLTSMVLERTPAMKSIVTHGFTVDAKGQKMSKSRGNVVSPQELIADMGTDGLRLWVASTDVGSDPVVSKELMDNVKEVYRKLRNTLRFLISNLYDFDLEKDAVALEELRAIDVYALSRLAVVSDRVRTAYAAYKFTTVFHTLADFCTVDLSSFYLDIIKDRLYTARADGKARRAAQTVCWYILDSLTRLAAPVLSFTSELASDAYQREKDASIHLQQFAAVDRLWQRVFASASAQLPAPLQREKTWLSVWEDLLAMRTALLKKIEEQRAKSVIKHSLEVKLVLHFNDRDKRVQQVLHYLHATTAASGVSLESFWEEFLIVSQVELLAHASDLEPTSFPGLMTRVLTADGTKCPRCWRYDITEHAHGLCRNCEKIIV